MKAASLLSRLVATENDTLAHRLSWVAWFVFANVPIAWLLALRFLKWMTIPDVATGVYLGMVHVGQYALLAWLPGLLLLPLAMVMKRRWLIPCGIVLAAIAQGLLLIDVLVYGLYRFHLSGFILETLIKAGAHTFDFSWQVWLAATLAIVTLLVMEAAIALSLARQRPRARWLGAAFAVLFVTQAGAHGWHAWANATYDTRITALTRHVPLYYAATAKRFLREQGWVDAQALREDGKVQALANLNISNGLDYPTQPLECRPPKTRPNILMIAVDALRADMLDPRWMPHVSAFAESGQTFSNHYSGGNSTKAGGFSLFYGLPPTYWDAFEGSQTPPVWISRLQQLGYETEILSAATLISPAFDRTAFAGIEDIRLTPPGEEAWQRDRLITNDWLDFTAQRDQQAAPFFGFLFYKAVHGYSVPPDFPRIEPYWKTTNHLALDQDFDPTPYFNRYKTATRYVDQLIGRVLDDLRQRDLLDNTIVMLTSDHGEEFNDNGKNYWGHGSNYSDAQLKVPMVVHWPGKAKREITRRTSHADIPATFMQSALGCPQTMASAYSTGSSLFSPQEREWLIAGSYMNYAVVTDSHLIVTYPTGQYEIMTKTLEPDPGYSPPATMLTEVLGALSRFYN